MINEGKMFELMPAALFSYSYNDNKAVLSGLNIIIIIINIILSDHHWEADLDGEEGKRCENLLRLEEKTHPRDEEDGCEGLNVVASANCRIARSSRSLAVVSKLGPSSSSSSSDNR